MQPFIPIISATLSTAALHCFCPQCLKKDEDPHSAEEGNAQIEYVGGCVCVEIKTKFWVKMERSHLAP